MRIQEFGNVKGHSTIEDVQKDHPEIYAFMERQIGLMALEQQTVVDMFDMSNSHHVVLVIKPAMSLDSTEMLLQRYKIQYERTQMASGDMISGTLPFANFRVTHDARWGNPSEEWNFEIPNKR